MKKLKLWLVAKGAEVLATLIIVLTSLLLLYLAALGSLLLINLDSIWALAAAIVVVSLVFGGAVTAVQWLVAKD